MKVKKPTIFISHYSEEFILANLIGTAILDISLEGVDVFLGSPDASFDNGAKWREKILSAAKGCHTMISILTPASIVRPWVNIEGGIAMGCGKPIWPLCFYGVKPEETGPFSYYTPVEVNSSERFLKLMKEVLKLIGISPPDLKSKTEIHFNLIQQLTEKPSEAYRSRTSFLPNNTIYCHGTKFSVPNAERFWIELAKDAQKRFILVGRSNKSWVDKDDKEELAAAIHRIVDSEGSVTIVSDSSEHALLLLRNFCKRYLDRSKLPNSSQRKKGFFDYRIESKTNYNAVISDDRLIVIPFTNDENFRDTAMVLDIPKSKQALAFKNYISDINRTIEKAALVDPWES